MRTYIVAGILSTLILVGYLILNTDSWSDSSESESYNSNDVEIQPPPLETNSQVTETVSAADLEFHETPVEAESANHRKKVGDALARITFVNAPFSRYQANISEARNSKAGPQYEVSRALQRCSITPRDEKLEEMLSSERFHDDVKARLVEENEQCSRLFRLIGAEEMSVGSSGWLQSAASQGHPLARLRVSLSTEFDPLVDKQQLFVEAFKLKSNDIYGMISLYHSMHGNEDETERSAWNALACKTNPSCPMDEVVSAIFEGRLEGYSSAVSNRIVEIQMAIEGEDWKAVVPLY
jgi:hypothetical protein